MLVPGEACRCRHAQICRQLRRCQWNLAGAGDLNKPSDSIGCDCSLAMEVQMFIFRLLAAVVEAILR